MVDHADGDGYMARYECALHRTMLGGAYLEEHRHEIRSRPLVRRVQRRASSGYVDSLVHRRSVGREQQASVRVAKLGRRRRCAHGDEQRSRLKGEWKKLIAAHNTGHGRAELLNHWLQAPTVSLVPTHALTPPSFSGNCYCIPDFGPCHL